MLPLRLRGLNQLLLKQRRTFIQYFVEEDWPLNEQLLRGERDLDTRLQNGCLLRVRVSFSVRATRGCITFSGQVEVDGPDGSDKLDGLEEVEELD